MRPETHASRSCSSHCRSCERRLPSTRSSIRRTRTVPPLFSLASISRAMWGGGCFRLRTQSSEPCMVFTDAILRAYELLPYNTCFEPVVSPFRGLMDHILKVPCRPWHLWELKLEETEANLVFLSPSFVEHDQEYHVMRRKAIVEGLRESGVIVAPAIRLEVVILVVL